jgi:16S rRNA (uracil1498-N3)-methyltransferase
MADQVLQEEAQAIAEAGRPSAPPALLMVGPEGDFTRGELDLILKAGARPVGLGPTRLRVETAAIALLTSATMFVEAHRGSQGALLSSAPAE